MKIDLHTHIGSTYIGQEELLATAIRNNGLDGIAITNTHDVDIAIRLKEQIRNVHIIVGQEITSKVYHILALNISSKIDDGLDEHQTIDLIHRQNGIAVLAHPLFTRHNPWVLFNDIKSLEIDAVESYNSFGGYTLIINPIMDFIARICKVPGIAASDGHYSADYIGRAYIDIESGTDEEIISNIRKGAFKKSKKPHLDLDYIRFYLLKRCFRCGEKLIVTNKYRDLVCIDCSKKEKSRIACGKGHYYCPDCWGKRFRKKPEYREYLPCR